MSCSSQTSFFLLFFVTFENLIFLHFREQRWRPALDNGVWLLISVWYFVGIVFYTVDCQRFVYHTPDRKSVV